MCLMFTSHEWRLLGRLAWRTQGSYIGSYIHWLVGGPGLGSYIGLLEIQGSHIGLLEIQGSHIGLLEIQGSFIDWLVGDPGSHIGLLEIQGSFIDWLVGDPGFLRPRVPTLIGLLETQFLH